MAPPDIDTIPYHSSGAKDELVLKKHDFTLAPKRTIPSRVLEIDAKTKDSKICRDERMIRLTGTSIRYSLYLLLTRTRKSSFQC